MNFASDNVTAAAPEIMAGLAAANHGAAMPYGADPWSAAVTAKLKEIFERDLAVVPMATGSSANALALSVFTPPWGVIYAHEFAHAQEDECGAPEQFTGGAKMIPIPGAHGKITPEGLRRELDRRWTGVVHHAQPACLSLTQLSEAGTAYTVDEIRAVTDLAHAHGLKVHMDGARFANALVSLGCSAAEMSWRSGIDVLSFGATKNGALAAEAVIFFDPADAATAGFRRKRAGHLFSKMRFLTAQLDAYLTEDRWLGWARHANAMAARLAAGLRETPHVSFLHPVDGNELFVAAPERVMGGLEADGFTFYRWAAPEGLAAARLVAAWSTDPAMVDHFVSRAQVHATQNA